MPKLILTSQQRSALRAAAHSLKPVVIIGDRGLTEAVIKEVDVHLNAHQLIKVRVAGDDREARVAMYDTLCEALSCAPVGHVGKILILHRPDAAKELAEAEARNATRAQRKPGAPYTPKKQAAEGKSVSKSSPSASPRARLRNDELTAPPAVRRKSAAASKTTGGRAAAPAGSRPAAHGVPRRSEPRGSALSLKAGARRRSGGGR